MTSATAEKTEKKQKKKMKTKKKRKKRATGRRKAITPFSAVCGTTNEGDKEKQKAPIRFDKKNPK